MFTAKDVMALRERTGAGMMDCKKALTECNGDAEKAIDFLREKGLAAAAKKAGRIAAEGIVGSYMTDDRKVGVIVEVNCETDFVAKTDDFKAFVATIAKQIAVKNPATVEELMEQTLVDDPAKTVNMLLNEAVAKIGEKISIRRFQRAEGVVDTYVHLGGKIGVLVDVEGEAVAEKLHDVAMQIAAAKPNCISRDDVNQADVEKEKEILRAQALNEPKPKPEAIIEKMVNGRIEKYYKEVCLMEQPFVKDQDQSVGQMVGGAFKVLSFTRFEMGEGLQKREDNFAEEVMSQTKA
ncbi:MAG: translation elongation factor Ts [Christensenellales bacterium]|jgi:elongation factor Ts|nr:translation elongation factor Ts [Clostridium sp.]MDD7139810.1 translation elongation factor Ts [Clostridium sp.]MDY6081628.1 translation elongation factor Ts [Eubacteriales bacterium]CCX42439.1 elongation factor Ts [Clostridium sp. CAG:1024]